LRMQLAQASLFVWLELLESIELGSQAGPLFVVELVDPLAALAVERGGAEPFDSLGRHVGETAEAVEIVAQFLLQGSQKLRRVELCVDVDVVDHRQVGQQRAVGATPRELEQEKA